MTSSDSPGTDFVESGHQQNKDYVCMNAYDCILVVFIYVCVEYLLIISISCSINPIACCEKKCDCTQAQCWVFSSAPWPCRRSPYQGKSSCSLMVLLGKTYAETNGFQMVFPSSLGFCSRDSWIFLRFPEHGTRHLLVMKNKEKKWKILWQPISTTSFFQTASTVIHDLTCQEELCKERGSKSVPPSDQGKHPQKR